MAGTYGGDSEEIGSSNPLQAVVDWWNDDEPNEGLCAESLRTMLDSAILMLVCTLLFSAPRTMTRANGQRSWVVALLLEPAWEMVSSNQYSRKRDAHPSAFHCSHEGHHAEMIYVLVHRVVFTRLAAERLSQFHILLPTSDSVWRCCCAGLVGMHDSLLLRMVLGGPAP